jgi:hypothetical protein
MRDYQDGEVTGVLLLRKGRVLEPRSRLRYRWTRLRTGNVVGATSGDPFFDLGAIVIRAVTIPFLTLFDLVLWPLALVTLARGKWYVVSLRFSGPGARFDRIAEAESFEEIKRRRQEIESRGG